MPTITLTDRKIASLKATGRQQDFFDRSFPGFGVRVNQQGRKTFILMYRTAEKKLRRQTVGVYGPEPPAIGLAQARQAAREELDKATVGRDPAAEKKQAKARTFDALAELYLTKHAKRHKRSWRDDDWRIRRVLLPVWGTRPVTAIRRADVRGLLEGIIERGKNVEANRTLALIRKLFNFALDQEWVEANVAAKMPRPGGKDPSRARVLTADELCTLWVYLEQAPPESLPALDQRHWKLTRAVLKVRLITAQRGKEVVSMRWQDLESNWWTIPGTITKNKLPHRVPLTKAGLRVLRALKAEADDSADYVFAGVRGTRQRRGALEDLNIDDVRPHDFRRTAASMMTSAGIPRLVVAKVLNHISADAGVTAIYDRHSYDTEKRNALETWARILDGIVHPKKTSAKLLPHRGPQRK